MKQAQNENHVGKGDVKAGSNSSDRSSNSTKTSQSGTTTPVHAAGLGMGLLGKMKGRMKSRLIQARDRVEATHMLHISRALYYLGHLYEQSVRSLETERTLPDEGASDGDTETARASALVARTAREGGRRGSKRNSVRAAQLRRGSQRISMLKAVPEDAEARASASFYIQKFKDTHRREPTSEERSALLRIHNTRSGAEQDQKLLKPASHWGAETDDDDGESDAQSTADAEEGLQKGANQLFTGANDGGSSAIVYVREALQIASFIQVPLRPFRFLWRLASNHVFTLPPPLSQDPLRQLMVRLDLLLREGGVRLLTDPQTYFSGKAREVFAQADSVVQQIVIDVLGRLGGGSSTNVRLSRRLSQERLSQELSMPDPSAVAAVGAEEQERLGGGLKGAIRAQNVKYLRLLLLLRQLSMFHAHCGEFAKVKTTAAAIQHVCRKVHFAYFVSSAVVFQAAEPTGLSAAPFGGIAAMLSATSPRGSLMLHQTSSMREQDEAQDALGSLPTYSRQTSGSGRLSAQRRARAGSLRYVLSLSDFTPTPGSYLGAEGSTVQSTHQSTQANSELNSPLPEPLSPSNVASVSPGLSASSEVGSEFEALKKRRQALLKAHARVTSRPRQCTHTLFTSLHIILHRYSSPTTITSSQSAKLVHMLERQASLVVACACLAEHEQALAHARVAVKTFSTGHSSEPGVRVQDSPGKEHTRNTDGTPTKAGRGLLSKGKGWFRKSDSNPHSDSNTEQVSKSLTSWFKRGPGKTTPATSRKASAANRALAEVRDDTLLRVAGFEQWRPDWNALGVNCSSAQADSFQPWQNAKGPLLRWRSAGAVTCSHVLAQAGFVAWLTGHYGEWRACSAQASTLIGILEDDERERLGRGKGGEASRAIPILSADVNPRGTTEIIELNTPTAHNVKLLTAKELHHFPSRLPAPAGEGRGKEERDSVTTARLQVWPASPL